MAANKKKGKNGKKDDVQTTRSTSSTRSSSAAEERPKNRKNNTEGPPIRREPDVESDTYFDSDEEEGDLNRRGRVPMSFYDNEGHIGYTAEGKRLIQELDSTEIGKLLFHSDNPDAWRTIVDTKNNRMIKLTDEDLKIISRIRKGMYPKENYNQEDLYIEFDNEDA